MPRGRALVLTLAVLLVVAVGVVWVWRSRSAATTTAAPRTVTVQHGTVEQSVSATGTIIPATESDLAFQASGTVTSVPVAVGQTVTAGQTLATLDPSTLQQQVNLAQASVSAAQTAVNAATTTATSASAQAQLVAAQTKLASARQSLAAATLTSPIAGVVAAVNVQVGSQIGSSGTASTASASGSSASGAGRSGSGSAAGGTSSGGSTNSGSSSSGSSSAIVVINTSAWNVNAQVASSDLASLKAGLQAQITPNGSRQPLFGTVSTIGLIASSSSSGTSTFPVTIAITGSQQGLYYGTGANVSIITAQLDDVLTVPTMAISSNGSTSTVTVLKDGKETSVPVTLGRLFGNQTEITKGLNDGDQVVLPTFTRSSSSSGTSGGGGLGGIGGGFGGTGGGTGNRNGGTGGTGGRG